MDIPSIETRYKNVWESFVSGLLLLYTDVGKDVSDGTLKSLHEVIELLHWVPYKTAHGIVDVPDVNGSSRNIGSITGLFFEQVVCAVIVPHIRRCVPNVSIERNRCSDSKVRGVSRDPDLFIQNGGRSVIFEIKVVLTKPGIERAENLKSRYTQLGFLIS